MYLLIDFLRRPHFNSSNILRGTLNEKNTTAAILFLILSVPPLEQKSTPGANIAPSAPGANITVAPLHAYVIATIVTTLDL